MFSKPYFDRDGLILAIEDVAGTPKVLGFVHASFDVRADLADLDFETGVISQLRVIDCPQRIAIEDGLLAKAMEYLESKHTVRCYFGGRFPQAPFYQGLYGGSRLPGVMEGDVHVLAALERNGFEEERRIAILERTLDKAVKTPGGRQQMTVRRNYLINAIADPIEKSWWECCTLGMSERDRMSIAQKKDNHVAGSVSFWDMQPLGVQMHSSCRGLYDLSVSGEDQRSGLATHLVCESLKRLAANGATLVEAQTDTANVAALKLFEKLDFQVVAYAKSMARRLG